MAIIAEARYYSEDNVPLGLGPIEPRVGEESTYNIRLVLTNNLHNVENVQVQAKLPNTVVWSDKENHERGDLFFKAATNEVVWNIFNKFNSFFPDCHIPCDSGKYQGYCYIKKH